MGRDKALLTVRGEPLARLVAAVVRQAAGNATLVGDPASHAGLGDLTIPDRFPGEGPLGGILTALMDSRREWNLLAACDMPELKVELLDRLLAAAREAECDALVPVDPAGRAHPLCAVYRAGARTGLESAFAEGIRKVATALERVRTVPFPVAEAECFQNLNTPTDWAAYAAR
jgi:molybdenum cofactor guanylyltransferase